MEFWGCSSSDQQVLGCFQMQLRVLCAPAGITPDTQGDSAVTALQRSLLGILKILLLCLLEVALTTSYLKPSTHGIKFLKGLVT